MKVKDFTKRMWAAKSNATVKVRIYDHHASKTEFVELRCTDIANCTDPEHHLHEVFSLKLNSFDIVDNVLTLYAEK